MHMHAQDDFTSPLGYELIWFLKSFLEATVIFTHKLHNFWLQNITQKHYSISLSFFFLHLHRHLTSSHFSEFVLKENESFGANVFLLFECVSWRFLKDVDPNNRLNPIHLTFMFSFRRFSSYLFWLDEIHSEYILK